MKQPSNKKNAPEVLQDSEGENPTKPRSKERDSTMSTTSIAEHNRTYPDSVYVNAQGGKADLPVAVVEKIASTKPTWASYDVTDIGDSAIGAGGLLTSWASDYGDSLVNISQDTYYDAETGEKLREDAPRIEVWGGDPAKYTDPAVACAIAADLLKAAYALEFINAAASGRRIVTIPRGSRYVDEVTQFHIGVQCDQEGGEPRTYARPAFIERDPLEPDEFDTAKPGDSHWFSIDEKEYPAQQNTYVGLFNLLQIRTDADGSRTCVYIEDPTAHYLNKAAN